MSLTGWGAALLAYHLASRLAYVLYVGVSLRRQAAHAYFTVRYGVEEGFGRFQRRAARVMNNDGISFVLVCLFTRGSLQLPLPQAHELAVGLVLVALGVGIKLWAGATLGRGAYYWRDFFTTGAAVTTRTDGPYRFLKHPMYTVGYCPTYGLALMCDSWPGLVASAFDQAAILGFYYLVERPHHRKLYGGGAPTSR